MDGANNGHTRVFMYRREQSASLGELFAALAKAKLEPEWCAQIAKNAKAQYGGFVNMAGLIGSTEAALSKHSLVVNQTFHYDTEPLLLVTELGHGGSGQFIRSILPIPKLPKVQEQKSVITYMRRAGYEALLGLAPSDPKADDDGDAANSAQAPAHDPTEWRRLELVAKQKIGAARTKAELLSLVARVHAKFEAGELPQSAVDRLIAAAEERRAVIVGELAE